jgi:adenine deaminase
MYLMIRYGSTAKNLKDLLPVITAQNSRRCIFVSDDLHTKDLLEHGHINFILRRAVTFGLDPVTAIRMVTLNPAEYFGLRDMGALAPGYRADMVVLENLDTFRPAYVFHRGKLVAERGRYLSDRRPDISPAVSAMNVALPPDAFRIRASGERVRMIEVIPGQIVTGQNVLPAKTENGEIKADSGRDILKIAVVERYRGSGRIGLGLVQGFGLKTGALASTVAHDSHNIVLVGANDGDMRLAVNKLAETGGGQIVVDRGEVKAILPLPIAGLMSELPAPEVAARVRELHEAALKLGCKLQAPFMAMAFLALPVIPELKITDMGLVDVKKFKIVDLFA